MRRIAGEDLFSNQILREKLYVAVPAQHSFADRKGLSLPDIRNEAFVFLKDGRCYCENIASAFRRAKLHPNVIAESSSAPHVLAMVSSGIGISVVPEHVIDLRRGDCSFIPVAGDDAYSEIGLVQLKTHHLNRVQLAFAKFLGDSAARKQGKQATNTAA